MEKIRIGVLGLRRGIAHLRNFLALDQAEVVAACDRFPYYRDQARVLVDNHGSSTEVLVEFDDLLERKPDAVVVASNGRLRVGRRRCDRRPRGNGSESRRAIYGQPA